MSIPVKHFFLESAPRLQVHEWGEDLPQTAPLVLCVQGLGGHGMYYDFLAPALVPHGVRLIAFDLRGHGHSAGVRGDIQSFNEYVEDLKVLLSFVERSFPNAPVHLLGESMGASIAIAYLRENSRSITSLVLVAPVLQPFMSFSLKEVFKFFIWAPINRRKPVLNLRGKEEDGCRDAQFNDFLRADKLFMEKASVRFMSLLGLFINRGFKNFHAIQMPLIVFQGGQDKVTGYKGVRKKFEKLSQIKKWVLLPEAYHCLLHDPLTPVLEGELLQWIKSF
jgi:alpha-beta hydrolase superfamily lysophospholipase